MPPASRPIGASGVFVDPDGNGVHGLDERAARQVAARTLATFLYRLIKRYTAGKGK
jgi:hypothetical protein